MRVPHDKRLSPGIRIKRRDFAEFQSRSYEISSITAGSNAILANDSFIAVTTNNVDSIRSTTGASPNEATHLLLKQLVAVPGLEISSINEHMLVCHVAEPTDWLDAERQIFKLIKDRCGTDRALFLRAG
jgi:hypothetical protein